MPHNLALSLQTLTAVRSPGTAGPRTWLLLSGPSLRPQRDVASFSCITALRLTAWAEHFPSLALVASLPELTCILLIGRLTHVALFEPRRQIYPLTLLAPFASIAVDGRVSWITPLPPSALDTPIAELGRLSPIT
jgi:hypothetical protein